MSRDKQIEELTRIIWDNPNMYDLPSAEDVAFAIYDAGYRKIKTNDWLTRGISAEELEREKREALDEFAKQNGYRKASVGKWVMEKFPLTKCSVCGATRNCETEIGWNYCPSCGAEMKGG